MRWRTDWIRRRMVRQSTWVGRAMAWKCVGIGFELVKRSWNRAITRNPLGIDDWCISTQSHPLVHPIMAMAYLVCSLEQQMDWFASVCIRCRFRFDRLSLICQIGRWRRQPHGFGHSTRGMCIGGFREQEPVDLDRSRMFRRYRVYGIVQYLVRNRVKMIFIGE